MSGIAANSADADPLNIADGGGCRSLICAIKVSRIKVLFVAAQRRRCENYLLTVKLMVVVEKAQYHSSSMMTFKTGKTYLAPTKGMLVVRWQPGYVITASFIIEQKFVLSQVILGKVWIL